MYQYDPDSQPLKELGTHEKEKDSYEHELPYMKNKVQQSKMLGYITVGTAICIHLFCGCMYLWGNVSTYVVTYYHFIGDQDASLKLGVLVLPLGFTMQSVANPLGAYLQTRWNPKFILLLGLSIMSLSILAASFVKSWWAFVAFYSIGYPIGIGTVYWVPIMCGWEWFPDNKGLVSGLVVGGYGFGAFIFGFITTAIANPDDLKVEVPKDGTGITDKLFPKSVGEEVPHMYRICLIIWVVLGLISVAGVNRNPEYIRQE